MEAMTNNGQVTPNSTNGYEHRDFKADFETRMPEIFP